MGVTINTLIIKQKLINRLGANRTRKDYHNQLDLILISQLRSNHPDHHPQLITTILITRVLDHTLPRDLSAKVLPLLSFLFHILPVTVLTKNISNHGNQSRLFLEPVVSYPFTDLGLVGVIDAWGRFPVSSNHSLLYLFSKSFWIKRLLDNFQARCSIWGFWRKLFDWGWQSRCNQSSFSGRSSGVHTSWLAGLELPDTTGCCGGYCLEQVWDNLQEVKRKLLTRDVEHIDLRHLSYFRNELETSRWNVHSVEIIPEHLERVSAKIFIFLEMCWAWILIFNLPTKSMR